METVTITSTRAISLDDMKPLIDRHWPTKARHERLAVEGATSRVYIYHPRLQGQVDARRIYLHYHSIDLVQKIIELVGHDPDLRIENGLGTILPGARSVAKFRSGPEWQWRV